MPFDNGVIVRRQPTSWPAATTSSRVRTSNQGLYCVPSLAKGAQNLPIGNTAAQSQRWCVQDTCQRCLMVLQRLGPTSGSNVVACCTGVRAIHGGYKGVRRSPSSGLREAYPSSLEQLHRLDCASSSRVLQGNVRRYTVHLVVVIRGPPESSARPSVPFGAAHSCKKYHNKGRHLLPLGLWILICAHHKSATDAPNMAARMSQRPDI